MMPFGHDLSGRVVDNRFSDDRVRIIILMKPYHVLKSKLNFFLCNSIYFFSNVFLVLNFTWQVLFSFSSYSSILFFSEALLPLFFLLLEMPVSSGFPLFRFFRVFISGCLPGFFFLTCFSSSFFFFFFFAAFNFL